MSLEGTWIITNHWNGANPYHFSANFGKDGTIAVEGQKEFFGTWTVLGSSSQVALAIADFKNPSITSYNGNVLGGAMGGEMTGGAPGQSTFAGVWSAQQQAHADAPHKRLSAPGQGS